MAQTLTLMLMPPLTLTPILILTQPICNHLVQISLPNTDLIPIRNLIARLTLTLIGQVAQAVDEAACEKAEVSLTLTMMASLTPAPSPLSSELHLDPDPAPYPDRHPRHTSNPNTGTERDANSDPSR